MGFLAEFCENQTQDITFGIDPGYINIGFSAITDKKELASGVVILDNKTSSRLTERNMYRKHKREKLWYRKPRFLNRKNMKKGWLPPSIQRRYDAHLRIISLYKSILPITKIIIEVSNFDIQKINNQNIDGIDYQKLDVNNFKNIKSYLFEREKGICQLCNTKIEKGERIEIHHKQQRNEGGTDSAKNLALTHEKCHKNLHKKGLKLQTSKQFKAETFMTTIKSRFISDIPNLNITFGYLTSIKRNEQNLKKTHYNDAFIIAGGTTQERISSIEILQKHKNNRSLQLNRKGFKPAIRRQRYKIQPKDLIWINGIKHTAKGTHQLGNRVVVNDKKSTSYLIKKVQKIYNFGSFSFI